MCYSVYSFFIQISTENGESVLKVQVTIPRIYQKKMWFLGLMGSFLISKNDLLIYRDQPGPKDLKEYKGTPDHPWVISYICQWRHCHSEHTSLYELDTEINRSDDYIQSRSAKVISNVVYIIYLTSWWNVYMSAKLLVSTFFIYLGSARWKGSPRF